MGQPALLDVGCFSPTAALGFYLSGWDVTGVHRTQRRKYPLKQVLADPIRHLRRNSGDFDVIFAAAPDARAVDVNSPLMQGMFAAKKPWVVAVPPAVPMPEFADFGIMLCGLGFRQPYYRHRLFASSLPIPSIPHLSHNTRLDDTFARDGIPTLYGRFLGVKLRKLLKELKNAA